MEVGIRYEQPGEREGGWRLCGLWQARVLRLAEMLAELLVKRLGRVWTFLLSSSCSRRGQSSGPHALGNAQVASGTDV
jgi:hypothetical protein